MDDIFTSVDMTFEQPGNTEMIIHYDEEVVQQILRAAISQNLYSKPGPSDNTDDPFNLSPLIEEYTVYEKKFKKWLGKTVRNGWLNFVKRQNEIARDIDEEVAEIIEEVTEAMTDNEQLMIIPWKDPILASVVEVANYYSEGAQQEEPVERPSGEPTAIIPSSEPSVIIPSSEPNAIIPIAETAEKSESSSLGLSLSPKDIMEGEVKP